MRRAEREVGENIPDEMIGEDDGDVRDVTRHDGEERHALPVKDPDAA